MAGTLLLLYALQSIFGCIPQSIFVVAWVIVAIQFLLGAFKSFSLKIKENNLKKLNEELEKINKGVDG